MTSPRHHQPSGLPLLNLAALRAANPALTLPTGPTTEHYITLFDQTFLPQGLCLYYSLVQHGGDFQLWVLAMDQACLNSLEALNLPRLRILDLSRLETPALLSIKAERTRAEYCWTLTPSTFRFVWDSDSSIQRVTYVDADFFFFKSPRPIFKDFEASGKAVLITDHHYAPDYDQAAACGQYCVQFLAVERERGEPIRQWWEERCLEWCHNRLEDGRFGDQKYLESFPLLFGDAVHIMPFPAAFQAPWNASIFTCSHCIAYHFHGLRLLGDQAGRVLLSRKYRIPVPTLQALYGAYLRHLRSIQATHEIHLPRQTDLTNPLRAIAAALRRLCLRSTHSIFNHELIARLR